MSTHKNQLQFYTVLMEIWKIKFVRNMICNSIKIKYQSINSLKNVQDIYYKIYKTLLNKGIYYVYGLENPLIDIYSPQTIEFIVYTFLDSIVYRVHIFYAIPIQISLRIFK